MSADPLMKPQGFWDIFPFQIYFLSSSLNKSGKKPTISQSKNPMRLQSCLSPEAASTFNTKCFCFVPPHHPCSLPSSTDTKKAATLWANDSKKKKSLGPQCVHSSFDSSALGSAEVWDSLKETFKQFGNKISFTAVAHQLYVRYVWYVESF